MLSPEMRRRSSTSDINKLEKHQPTPNDEPDSISIMTDDMDTVSVSSGEVLDWKEEEEEGGGGHDEDSTLTPVLREKGKNKLDTTLFVADKGNRLSQLDLDDENSSQKQIESIVEIAYDL